MYYKIADQVLAPIINEMKKGDPRPETIYKSMGEASFHLGRYFGDCFEVDTEHRIRFRDMNNHWWIIGPFNQHFINEIRCSSDIRMGWVHPLWFTDTLIKELWDDAKTL